MAQLPEQAGARAVEIHKRQLVYDNVVGHGDVAKRAREVAENIRVQHKSAMQPMFRRFNLMSRSLRGTSTGKDLAWDVASSEVYKINESLVPRIVGAVTQFDPMFRIVASQPMDRAEAEARGALLEWQLRQMGWDDWVEPSVRTMLPYQVVAAKVWYDREVETKKVPKPIFDPETKKLLDIQHEEKEFVLYDGPRMCIVDPFDFIIDNRASRVEDAQFIGDCFRITETELRRNVDLGLYDAAAANNVLEKRRGDWEDEKGFYYDEHWKNQRSVLERLRMPHDQTSKSVEREFHGVEIWTRFKMPDAGDEKPWSILTVIEGEVVQVRRNYLVYSNNPYAVGRTAREAHDFYNTGPYDLCLRVESEYDHLRASVSRIAALSANPIIATDAIDAPQSLFDLEPGHVMTGVSNLNVVKMPSTIGDALTMFGIYRQDVEEIAGAPRVFQGGEAGNTATEVERRLREGNMRIQGLVRAFVNYFDGILRIMDGMNRQFLTEEVTFPVIGKRSKMLRDDYLTVTREMLLQDVKFRFMGLDNLHVLGSRQTAIAQFMSVAGPFIMQSPKVDRDKLIDRWMRLAIDNETADSVLKEDRSMELWSQLEENIYLQQGQKVEVNMMDDHEGHLRDLEPLKAPQIWGDLTPEAQQAIEEHEMQHAFAAERVRAEQAAQQRLASQQAPPGEGGLTPGAPLPGGFETPAQSPPGETPGPAREGGMSRAGREQPGFQQQRLSG